LNSVNKITLRQFLKSLITFTMIKKSITSIILFLLSLSTIVSAQYEKFGKLTPSLNKPDFSIIDSTAAAVIIFDVAKVSINKDFEIEMQNHKRVLIQNENGYNQGTFVLIYYSEKDYEEVVDLEALNWVPEGNDRFKKVKLSKKSIYKEVLSNGFTQLKFTIPELTPGSIIEYHYIIKSNNLQKLPKWFFQTSIPVMYSEYETDFSSIFKFEFNLKGSLDLTERNIETYEGNFYFEIDRNKYSNAASSVQSGSIRSTHVKNKFFMINVPAYESEPYSTSKDNLISSLEVSLRAIFWPQSKPTEFFTNWENTGDGILNDDTVSNYFKETNEIDLELKALSLDLLPYEVKAEKIYAYITKSYKFNDELGLFPDKSRSKLHKEKFGNASSINLLYFEMCKLAGLDVYPIALSTKTMVI